MALTALCKPGTPHTQSTHQRQHRDYRHCRLRLSDPRVTKEPFPEVHILSREKPLHSALLASFPGLQNPCLSAASAGSKSCCSAPDSMRGTWLTPLISPVHRHQDLPCPAKMLKDLRRTLFTVSSEEGIRPVGCRDPEPNAKPTKVSGAKDMKPKSPSQAELCAVEAVGQPSSSCSSCAGQPVACQPSSATMWAASQANPRKCCKEVICVPAMIRAWLRTSGLSAQKIPEEQLVAWPGSPGHT